MEEKYVNQVVCLVNLFVLRHSGTAQTNIPVTFRTNAISTYFMLQSQPRDVFSLFVSGRREFVFRMCSGGVSISEHV
jgi:hypothetical protein